MSKQVKGTYFGWLDPFNGYSDTNGHGLKENKIMLVMMKKMNLMRIWWVITLLRVPNGIELCHCFWKLKEFHLLIEGGLSGWSIRGLCIPM